MCFGDLSSHDLQFLVQRSVFVEDNFFTESQPDGIARFHG